MASAMDSRLAYARLSAGRYGKPPTHSYQRLQQLLHHVLGHDRKPGSFFKDGTISDTLEKLLAA